MTHRMHHWSTWQHDRVYKPNTPLNSASTAYLQRLDAYATEVAFYLRALDDGQVDVPRPRFEEYNLQKADDYFHK